MPSTDSLAVENSGTETVKERLARLQRDHRMLRKTLEDVLEILPNQECLLAVRAFIQAALSRDEQKEPRD